MDNPHINPRNSYNKRQINSFKVQKKIFFEYLKRHTATASMVAKVTGIPQKNITRYKREFEKTGLLKEVFKGNCKDTGFKAWYLSTNPELFPTIVEPSKPKGNE